MVSSPSISSSPSLSSRFRRFSFRVVVVVRLFLLRRRRLLLDDDDEDVSDDDEDVSDDDEDEDVSDDDDEESSRRRFVAIFVGLLSFSFCNRETSLEEEQTTTLMTIG